VKLVTTRGVGDAELRVIDTREVEGTSGLHLAHGEAEWPRVGGNVVDGTIGEVSAVHLGDDIMVVHVRHVLEERHTVDVERSLVEGILGRVVGIIGITRHEVERLHWVVEVAEVKLGIGVRRQLVLSLGDEEFVFVVGEELALISVEVHIVTVHLGGTSGGVTITTLYTNLDIVVLERHEGERLRPVFTEEEGNHEVVTRVVLLTSVRGHGEGRLGRRVTHESVVNTLNVEGVELTHLLTTNPQLKFGGVGRGTREETIGVTRNVRDEGILDPNVAHEITLRANGDSHFIVPTKSADVVQAFGLHGEVGVAFVVLTEEADLGITRDVDILGAHRH